MDKLRYYIDGPGECLVVATDYDMTAPDPSKILATVTCKGVKITANADLEDVTGGRSLFPQRQFPTKRTASVEFTDCEMDFRYAQMVSGETTMTGAQTVWAFGSDYHFTVPSAAPYTVSLPNTPLTGTVTVRDVAAGTVNNVAATTAAAGSPTLADKVLTFVADDAGKTFELMYQYTSAATTKQTSLKVDSLPQTVKFIHKQPTFDDDNNITGYQFIEFFKLQPSPEFNEDYQERAAYAPAITLGLIDPKRADKKVYDRTWVPVAAG